MTLYKGNKYRLTPLFSHPVLPPFVECVYFWHAHQKGRWLLLYALMLVPSIWSLTLNLPLTEDVLNRNDVI